MKAIADWLGWTLLMRGPFRIVAHTGNPIGRWCLRHAGAWAYRR